MLWKSKNVLWIPEETCNKYVWSGGERRTEPSDDDESMVKTLKAKLH